MTTPATRADRPTGAEPRRERLLRELIRRTSFLQLVRSELARIVSRPLAALALFALMCVPLLYGGAYLWANKDPQGNLHSVPAALVVDDDGGMVDGEFHNYGDEVADKLLSDGTLAWQRVDEATALRGVDDGTFYFALQFPPRFTSQLTSGGTTDPTQAAFILTTNDANSYLGTNIANTVAQQVVDTMATKVGEQAASSMLYGLTSAHDGFAEAADGAGQLREALTTAVDGAQQLASGASALHTEGTSALRAATADLPSQANALADGASKLETGAGDLADGAHTAADGASQLASGASDLASGAAQVADGNAQLAAKADELDAGLHTLVDSREAFVDDVVAALEQRGLDPAVLAQIRDAVGTAYDTRVAPVVTEQLAQVDAKVAQIDALAAGAQQVADGAAKLHEGASSLATGTTTLANGADALHDGAGQLADGTAQFAASAPTLADGIAQLDDKAGLLAEKLGEFAGKLPQAVDGARTLHDRLAEGADKLPAAGAQLRADQARTISDPIASQNDAMTKAGGYGEGVAPMFLALSAWLGMFTVFMVIWPYSKRAVTAMRHPVPIAFAGWLVPALLGLLEMTAVTFIVHQWVGLEFAWPMATWAVLVVSAWAFAALFQALRTWLDSVGQFIGMLLMVLQVAAGGGTFPWQTLPGPLAAIHHWMPMGWTIDALRQTMYGGDPALVWRAVGMLVTLGLVAWGATLVAIWMKTRSRTLRDLREPVIH